MSWDALTAIGSVAGALILLVGSVAAVIQIGHLRVASQLESYLQLHEKLHSAEMVEARTYIDTVDFTDPKALEAATTPDLDNRIRVIATHYQTVARLLNRGVLDEEMFAGYVVSAPHVWNAIAPALEIMRRRLRNPLFLDLQYLAYRAPHDEAIAKALKKYPKTFIEAAGLTNITSAPKDSAEMRDSNS